MNKNHADGKSGNKSGGYKMSGGLKKSGDTKYCGAMSGGKKKG